MSVPGPYEAIEYRDWIITPGEEDDDGRLPLKAVYFIHDDCDGSDRRKGWADTTEDAKAIIDRWEDHGILPGA